ncbi:hypothetical protein GEV33_013039 [Tenebrio molitor]|uniref:Uncharacterized protein n=1 Tax=Tenebrio molitor TaxID=7067 RepID=A0A8J6LEA8_TENMO|nr:hypothetical protein GEV33_013039 [Tenebrio molitor]
MASFGETFQCKKYIKGVGGIVSFKGLASEWHKLVNDVFSVFVLEAGGAKLRGSLTELKMDVLREREVKDNLERQLVDEQKIRGSLFEPKESMWPVCGDGHTYPVWPFYGGFEIVPEKHLRDYGSLDPLRLHPAGAWCRPRPVPIENDDKAVRAELRISTRRLALEHAKILKMSKSDNPFDRITQSEINITDSPTVNPDTFDPASKNEITTKATSAAALNPPDIITGFI